MKNSKEQKKAFIKVVQSLKGQWLSIAVSIILAAVTVCLTLYVPLL